MAQPERATPPIRHHLPASGEVFPLVKKKGQRRMGKIVGNEIYLPCTNEHPYIRIVHKDGRVSRVHPLGAFYQDSFVPDPAIDAEGLMMPEFTLRAEERRRR